LHSSPRLTPFAPKPNESWPNTQIGASVAEDIFELLNLRSQDHAVGHIVDIRKESDLEEYEKPEPESKERTVTSFEFD
jgi:hypothetical protein